MIDMVHCEVCGETAFMAGNHTIGGLFLPLCQKHDMALQRWLLDRVEWLAWMHAGHIRAMVTAALQGGGPLGDLPDPIVVAEAEIETYHALCKVIFEWVDGEAVKAKSKET